MRFSAALLAGLGARIFLDIITRPPGLSLRDAILTGIWQGVALYHTYTIYLDFLFLVAFTISAWLMIDFALIQDVNRMTTILLGVALGVFCTNLLSQLEDGIDRRRRSVKHDAAHSSSKKYRSGYKDTRARAEICRRPSFPALSDITAPSLDTSTDTLDSRLRMSPLEREVASLRTRASLADTERRRYKEERKWALSQGNVARAEQMRWQVKRYTTLMHSFNREADAILTEGVTNPQSSSQEQSASSSSRSNIQQTGISSSRPRTQRQLARSSSRTRSRRHSASNALPQPAVANDSTNSHAPNGPAAIGHPTSSRRGGRSGSEQVVKPS